MATGNAHILHASMRKRESTLHARKRMAQRAIGQSEVDLILAFGHREHDGRGGTRVLMTHAALDRLRRAVGHTSQVDRLAGKYVVLGNDGAVVTVGHLYS